MSLSSEAIVEFKNLYEKSFKEVISFDEAKEKGLKLLELFRIIYKPLQINNNKNEKNRA